MEAVSAGVPEVDLGTGIISPGASAPPTFSGKWEDFGKDMAAIAQEQTPAQPESAQASVTLPPMESPKQEVSPVVPPAAPQAAEPPKPEIPDKFRAPDGTLDQEKLLKSYFEAEKSLKRAQNAPKATAQPSPVAQPAPVAAPQAATPFEQQVAQDMMNEAAALGQPIHPAVALAQARIQIKLLDAKHQADTAAVFGRVAQFEEQLAQQNQRLELSSLAKSNPEVLTPKGYEELVKIREENPWINASPEPWKTAATILLGQKSMYRASAPGNVPTPNGVQQTVPPLPATPAQTPQTPTQLNSPAQVEAYVKTLSPEQEAKFWNSMGLRFDAPKQFKGVF